MASTGLPVGKVPPSLLAHFLSEIPGGDPQVLLGPGLGLDCAVVDVGPTLLVFKSDPITFATNDIGWYLVHVNANDIATTGAVPRWLLMTVLLPEGKTTADLVSQLVEQVCSACRSLGVAVIGGHTEVTHGIDRPIVAGTMIGAVDRDRLVTPQGASPGNRIVLTKGVPIEATSLLAREFPERLAATLTSAELDQARAYLVQPGISVLRDARVAVSAGRITAMHDPTEGGLASALWELAAASGRSLIIDPSRVPVPNLAARVCEAFGLDPLAAIASGALLMTVEAADLGALGSAFDREGITWAEIGRVDEGPPAVLGRTESGLEPLPLPARDEIAKVYEE